MKSNPRIRPGADSRVAFLEELSEYCWCAYEKAFHSAGDLVIGRVQHLNTADLYNKVSEIIGQETLFDGKAKGNLLKMDKWACVVNDSWILGGIHRRAKFRLASSLVLENLWNSSGGYLVVTAREILGLLHFGYQLEQIGPWKVLVPQKSVLATTADLIKYDQIIQSSGTFRQAINLIDKKSPQSRLMADIRSRR